LLYCTVIVTTTAKQLLLLHNCQVRPVYVCRTRGLPNLLSLLLFVLLLLLTAEPSAHAALASRFFLSHIYVQPFTAAAVLLLCCCSCC
jgi:hypothetical protein